MRLAAAPEAEIKAHENVRGSNRAWRPGLVNMDVFGGDGCAEGELRRNRVKNSDFTIIGNGLVDLREAGAHSARARSSHHERCCTERKVESTELESKDGVNRHQLVSGLGVVVAGGRKPIEDAELEFDGGVAVGEGGEDSKV